MNRALLFVIASIVFFSCSEKKTEKAEKAPEPQVKSAVQVDPKVARLESLKKMPISGLDVLQRMLPEEMTGIRRTKFSMTSNLGYATAQADYEKNSRTYIHLAMYDCAGEQGAELYRSSFLSKLDQQEATEAGYMKTVDFGDGKAIEKYEANTKVTTLSFLINDKILVVMAGKNIPGDKMKESVLKIGWKIS